MRRMIMVGLNSLFILGIAAGAATPAYTVNDSDDLAGDVNDSTAGVAAGEEKSAAQEPNIESE